MEVLTSDVSTVLQPGFHGNTSTQDSILTLQFERKRKRKLQNILPFHFVHAFLSGENYACFTIDKQSLATDH